MVVSVISISNEYNNLNQGIGQVSRVNSNINSLFTHCPYIIPDRKIKTSASLKDSVNMIDNGDTNVVKSVNKIDIKGKVL